MMSETVTIPKEEYIRMKRELKALRSTNLYKRLLEFEENIKEKKYTREDLGF
jgi:PHD/YefM family antitoxin component YafN of YafNO toxin-antitoxin module